MANEKTLAELELDRAHTWLVRTEKQVQDAKEELRRAEANRTTAADTQAYWNGIVHLERQ
jgi:hypothetical protein